MTVIEEFNEKRSAILIKNLQSRGFEAYYCHSADEAREKALSLIPVGSTVGWGGTETCKEIGLIDAVRNGNFIALDRDRCKPEETKAVTRRAMTADVFLTSANAISMDGQMVNIDGYGNRVSAIICGAGSVIVVAGMNKVCSTPEEALARAKELAAPKNAMRLHTETPCAATGECFDCKSPACICNHTVITRFSREKGRIKFILIDGEFGY